MDKALERQIRQRARDRCEYCGMAQAFVLVPFQIDHIIAEQHGGATRLDNLAYACLHCNKHKGPNVAGIDPLSGGLARLFHPRRDSWKRHFHWDGPYLIGRTRLGRATIAVLAINHSYAVAARQTLIEEGLFPVE